MLSKTIKILSMVMSIIVLIMSLPLAGYATLVSSEPEECSPSVTENQFDTAIDGEAYVIGEDISKREKNVKYFRMSDGSYTACVYNYPVHYEKDGEMVEINNTVIQSEKNNGYYEISDNLVDILLPNEYSEDMPVVYTLGKHSISFVFDAEDSIKSDKKTTSGNDEMKDLKAENKTRKNKLKEIILSEYLSDEEYEKYFKKAKEEIKCSEKDLKASIKEFNELSMNIPNAISSISYNDVTDNLSIEYIIQGTTLKENIVLSTPFSSKTIEFIIKSDTLMPVLQEDNSVIFFDKENNAVIEIAAPFMYDAIGTTTDDILVKLKDKGNYYEYSLTPNKKWLEDEERIYPVTIDPPVQVGSFSTVKDTTAVFGSIGDLSIGSEPCYLKVGKRYNGGTGTVQEVQGMIYCALPAEIKSTSRIISAQLGLRGYATSELSTCSSDITIGAYRIIGDWNTSNIMENGVVTLGSSGNADYTTLIDYATVNDTDASVFYGSSVWFDITSIAQKWADGEEPNYGIALRGIELGNAENYARFFDSTNTSQPGACPQFYFAYRDTKGIEDYWTYTDMPAGKYGTIAVNNFNGNLIVTQNAVTTSGNYMPVAVSYIYNMCDNGTTNTGKWQTNYNMQIKPCDITHGSLIYSYYLIDDDGTEHYFYKTSDNTYKDEDGLELELSDNVSVYKYEITDKQDNKWYFHENGYLERISDVKGNFNDIFYNPNGTISYINEGNFANPGHNRRTYFEYLNEKVTITAPDGYKTEVNYNDATLSKIRTIKYYFGEQLLYTTTINYDSIGNVSAISDGLGRTVNVVYTTSVPRRVGFISYDTSSQTLERYDFEYKHNLTYIKDFKNRTVMYHFNDFGHTVGVTDFSSSRGITYEYGSLDKTIQNEALFDSNVTEKNKLLSSSRVISPSVNYITDGSISTSEGFTWDRTPLNSSEVLYFSPTTLIGHNDSRSLYLNKTALASYNSIVTQSIYNIPAGIYTLSAYVNTQNTVISGNGFSLVANIQGPNGLRSSTVSAPVTTTGSNNGWVRLSHSFEILEGDQYVSVGVCAFFNTVGQIWVDDIQLERASGAGSFNLLDDTTFYDTSSWAGYGFAAYDAYSGPDCFDRWFQVDGVYNEERVLSQTINISGSKGDIYSFGAWSFGTALSPTFTSQYRAGTPTFSANLTFYNDSVKVGETITVEYNHAMSNWQYAHNVAAATDVYTKIVFEIKYSYNANRAYFAAPFVYKENYGETYVYDDNGNLVSTVDLAETESNFAYTDNYLINSISPSGANYSYYYDNETNNIEYSVSSKNQYIDLEYDNTNKATNLTTSGFKRAGSIEEGKEYYIISYNASRALTRGENRVETTEWNLNNDQQKWRFQNYDGNVYKIYYVGDSSVKHYLYSNGRSNQNTSATTSSPSDLFECIIDSLTGTLTMKTSRSIYQNVLYDNYKVKNPTSLTSNTLFEKRSQGGNEEKWFLVEVEEARKYMSASVIYTDNGNNIASSTDTRGIVTEYIYNGAGSLLKETIKEGANEVLKTDYLYSDKNQLTQVMSNNTSVKYEYDTSDPGLLARIENSNGTIYSFIYDIFHRITGTKVGTRFLSQNTYTGNLLTKQVYGNGDFVDFCYDNIDRLYQKKYNDSVAIEYAYTANGEVASVIDYFANKQQFYTYDFSGRIAESYTQNLSSGLLYTHTIYDYIDAKNLLGGKTLCLYADATTPQKTLAETYTYGNPSAGEIPDALYGISVNGERVLSYQYDSLGRLINSTLNKANNTSTYSYEDIGTDGKTTTLVKEHGVRGISYFYDYDALGNIIAIDLDEDNSTKPIAEYTYDELNRLTRVNIKYDALVAANVLSSTDCPDNYTTVYTYDAGGNILEKKIYNYYDNGVDISSKTPIEILTYAYGNSEWKELLTNYDGTNITYDAIGNPNNWRDEMVFTWDNGRQLKDVVIDGSTYNYTYNADGIRIKKTSANDYEYILDESNRIVGLKKDSTLIATYYYDEKGSPIGMNSNDMDFWFTKNLQGDIIRVENEAGTIYADYYYDEWGVPTVVYKNAVSKIMLMSRAIFLYRGYVYDWETGFYYLTSRYYDPEVGRFLNADGMVSTGVGLDGYNMFAYCNNNPVVYADSSGMVPIWIVAGIAGAVVNVSISFFAATITGQEYTWKDAGIAALAGACNAIPNWGPVISGAISGIYSGYSTYDNGSTFGGAIVSGLASAVVTTGSIGNLAGFQGTMLSLVESVMVDLAFGTGGEIISSAISQSFVITNQNVTNKVADDSNRIRRSNLDNIIRSKRISNTRIVDGEAIVFDKNMSYVDRNDNRIYCHVDI